MVMRSPLGPAGAAPRPPQTPIWPEPKLSERGASLVQRAGLRPRFNVRRPIRSERGPAEDIFVPQAAFPVGDGPERGRGGEPPRPGGRLRLPQSPDVQEARPAQGSDLDEPVLREFDADAELVRAGRQAAG